VDTPNSPSGPCTSTRCSATRLTTRESAKWSWRDPLRIYHTEHLSAAGWTPEGEAVRAARIAAKAVTEIPFATQMEWIDRMRRFDAPMIFTLEDWGLADATLPETTVRAED